MGCLSRQILCLYHLTSGSLISSPGLALRFRNTLLTSQSYIFTARKRSLGQGNVFARVCHSLSMMSLSVSGPMFLMVSVRGGGLCQEGALCQDILHTAAKWEVHILLECCLVSVVLFKSFHQIRSIAPKETQKWA